MTPANRRLLRRYGIPVGLLVLSYAAWVTAAWMVTGPVASLWLFWLIAREPPAVGFQGKLPRLAAILLVLAPPTVLISMAVFGLLRSPDGEATGVMLLFGGPWLLVQVLAGLTAMGRIVFQRRSSEA